MITNDLIKEKIEIRIKSVQAAINVYKTKEQKRSLKESELFHLYYLNGSLSSLKDILNEIEKG